MEPMVSSSCSGAVHEGDANAIAIGIGAAGQFRPHLHCAVVSGEKGWVTRDIDSKDRRIIRVNLTDSGREQSHRMIEEMRSAICWIFSQMGERRTREFVDLVSEFTTYMSICHPGRPRPTAEQVREAFVERDKRVAEHMAAKRAEN